MNFNYLLLFWLLLQASLSLFPCSHGLFNLQIKGSFARGYVVFSLNSLVQLFSKGWCLKCICFEIVENFLHFWNFIVNWVRFLNSSDVSVFVRCFYCYNKPARFASKHHLRVLSWTTNSQTRCFSLSSAFCSLFLYLGLESALDIELLKGHWLFGFRWSSKRYFAFEDYVHLVAFLSKQLDFFSCFQSFVNQQLAEVIDVVLTQPFFVFCNESLDERNFR